jgi:hypothetical protein
LGDLAEFKVEVLGGPAEDVESLVAGDAFAFDEDPLGLANDLAGDQGVISLAYSGQGITDLYAARL